MVAFPVQISDSCDALAVSVSKAAAMAAISRSMIYEAMRAGGLQYLKIGSRRVILVDDLRGWLVALRDGVR